MIVDTHAHLTDKRFDVDLDDVIKRANDASVTRIISVADCLEAAEQSIEISDRYECVWATAGVHPHRAADVDDDFEAKLRGLLRHPRIVAVGEIGLDYHYDFAPRAVQIDVFRAQIRIAREVDLPLIIHNRESGDDVLAILEEEKADEVGGVLHCFWGTPDQAERAMALGFYIGVGGPVTFKNTEALRDMLKQIPLNRLLVETDAPYLAPVPHRGKRNEPAFTRLSAEALARLKGIDLEEVASITTANCESLFGMH